MTAIFLVSVVRVCIFLQKTGVSPKISLENGKKQVY